MAAPDPENGPSDDMIQLAAGVSHHLNNILSGITGNLELASRDAADSQRRWLAGIDRYVERGTELTKYLVMLSPRGERNPCVSVQVDPIIMKVAASCPGIVDSGVGVLARSAPDLPAVYADHVELEQALYCLCANAVEAMVDLPRAEQSLDIAADAIGRSAVRSRSPGDPGARSGTFVRIRVSDTGTGIAPQVYDHILEPFFTTKNTKHHAGLGLTVANAIVRRYAGWMEILSTPGQGTIVDAYLPAAESGSSSTSAPLPAD